MKGWTRGGGRRAAALGMGLGSVGLVIALLSTSSAVLVWPPRSAEAIPAFARRYQTSCQTCHVAFPALTPFGEAFRINGYRFPAGEDEDNSWDEPVSLGQQAHRRMFPDAIWPGEVPGAFPIAATLSMQSTWLDEAGDFEVRFPGVGTRVGLVTAGPIDNTFSAWAGIAVTAERTAAEREIFGVELERVFMSMSVFEDPYLVFRLGRFEPNLAGFSAHRTLGPAPWLLTSTVADNGFALEPFQLGLEAYGVAGQGRFAYSAGVVEGAGNRLEAAADVYASASYKFGGMRLDGIGGAVDPLPWRDNSVQIGAFGYVGRANIGEPDLATQDDRFFTVGGSLLANWWDLDLTMAYAYQQNDNASLARPNESLESQFVFSQLDWVAYPWLIPSLRYEWRDVGNLSAESRLVPAVYFLIRANIRAQIIAPISLPGEKVRLDQVIAGVNAAF